MLINPCPCARNREAAMSCPREARGRLIWSPTSEASGQPVGAAELVDSDGEREMLIFDSSNQWEHYSEGLARAHAAIRHLDFVVA